MDISVHVVERSLRMSNSPTLSASEQAAADAAAPYVQLFQKAHQKIVLLERLDEQIQQILGKRQELQDELKEVQTLINIELEQRIKASGEAPSKLLGAIAGASAAAAAAGRGNNGRFAAQTIDTIAASR
jgi:hypothetical protein